MSRRFLAPALAVFVVGCLNRSPVATAQTTWYVDDNASGDPGPGDPSSSDPNEDGSAVHPFDAIQEGIDDAAAGDTVLVLAGTYMGVSNRDVDFAGKAITVCSTDPNDPNVVAGTVLDCEGAGRGFSFHSGEKAGSILEGLTITNGNAYPSDMAIAFGCGIYIADSDPTVRKCTVTDNHWEALGPYGGATPAGGGIYCTHSDATIEDCLVNENTADLGGGICCVGGAPQITRCTITQNFAQSAAGLMLQGGSATIRGCTICDNDLDAFGSGGGLKTQGGSPTIIDCLIARNSGDPAFAGGIHASGDIHIVNCQILDNTVVEGSGGGIYHSSGDAVLTHCTLTGNRSDNGGAIWHGDGTLTVTNSVVAKNVAAEFEFPGWGGGIAWYGDLVITNCTLAGNEADVSPNLHCTRTGTLAATNSIFWDAPLTKDANHIEATVTYCDVQGGWTGARNIDRDPCFVDPNSSDYHLSSLSPCINAGDPNGDYTDLTDIDGESRVLGGRVDMGADEVTGTYQTITYTLTVQIVGPGDVEQDPADQTTFEAGETVTLRAVPLAEGDRFLRWEEGGEVATTDSEMTVLMDSDKGVTAVFREGSLGPVCCLGPGACSIALMGMAVLLLVRGAGRRGGETPPR